MWDQNTRTVQDFEDFCVMMGIDSEDFGDRVEIIQQEYRASGEIQEESKIEADESVILPPIS